MLIQHETSKDRCHQSIASAALPFCVYLRWQLQTHTHDYRASIQTILKFVFIIQEYTTCVKCAGHLIAATGRKSVHQCRTLAVSYKQDLACAKQAEALVALSRQKG